MTAGLVDTKKLQMLGGKMAGDTPEADLWGGARVGKSHPKIIQAISDRRLPRRIFPYSLNMRYSLVTFLSK